MNKIKNKRFRRGYVKFLSFAEKRGALNWGNRCIDGILQAISPQLFPFMKIQFTPNGNCVDSTR
ncbi:hypothetical protein EAJ01_18875 [Bacteroides cellulosilyticus]|nr:hypothetical protein EAJ01_18875 [Bacteroides cellulosilyticus]